MDTQELKRLTKAVKDHTITTLIKEAEGNHLHASPSKQDAKAIRKARREQAEQTHFAKRLKERFIKRRKGA